MDITFAQALSIKDKHSAGNKSHASNKSRHTVSWKKEWRSWKEPKHINSRYITCLRIFTKIVSYSWCIGSLQVIIKTMYWNINLLYNPFELSSLQHCKFQVQEKGPVNKRTELSGKHQQNESKQPSTSDWFTNIKIS